MVQSTISLLCKLIIKIRWCLLRCKEMCSEKNKNTFQIFNTGLHTYILLHLIPTSIPDLNSKIK